jgi:hypothetical protein
VFEQRLYVDGEQVPGEWRLVRAGDDGWIALRADDTWWWGRGPKASEITDVPPVISPNGAFVGVVRVQNGSPMLSGFATSWGGEGMGGIPVDKDVTVRAVTDDGRVIAQGPGTSLLWLPFVDYSTVDLTKTAPEQVVFGSTPAGLLVSDGLGGEAYLAEISDAGELSRTGAVPAHDDLVVGRSWLAWTTPGTTGGEVTSVTTLQAQTVDGGRQVTLNAPDGWGFGVRAWAAWEDDEHLVSLVIAEDGSERLARCGVQQARCVLIRSH